MRSDYRLLLASLVVVLASFLLVGLPVWAETAPRSTPRRDAVVYVRNGDIYTRDLPDGTIQQLTRDGGNSKPNWSPSGNWIVYRHSSSSDSSGGLRVIRRDGKEMHELPGYSGWQATCSFSPTTEEIAGISDDGFLVVMPLAGGKSRGIVAAPQGAGIVGVSWSPDGRFVAYVVEHGATYQHGEHSDYRISLWQADLSGRKAPYLLYVSHEHKDVPCIVGWTADSRYLLFWALHYFPAASINRDGLPLYACSAGLHPGKATLLFGKQYKSMVLSIPEYVRFPHQGSRVAVSVGGSRYPVQNKRIALTDLERPHSARFVTSRSLAATCPTWSPDGRQIAYLAVPTVGKEDTNGDIPSALKQIHLCVMSADGTHQRRLGSGRVSADRGPLWLSDSRHLLFERVAEGRGNSLWIIGADGHDLRCVVSRVGNDPVSEDDDDWSHNYFDVWSPHQPSR